VGAARRGRVATLSESASAIFPVWLRARSLSALREVTLAALGRSGLVVFAICGFAQVFDFLGIEFADLAWLEIEF
jgi:hypothetical protein